MSCVDSNTSETGNESEINAREISGNEHGNSDSVSSPFLFPNSATSRDILNHEYNDPEGEEETDLPGFEDPYLALGGPSEQEYYANVIGSLAVSDIRDLNKLRLNPKVRAYDGELSSRFKQIGACPETEPDFKARENSNQDENSLCSFQIVEKSTELAVYSNGQWISDRFRPTGIGQEVVEVVK